MNAINNDPNIPVKNNIIGPRYVFSRCRFAYYAQHVPSVSSAVWLEEVYNSTTYLTTYNNNLKAISVEK